MKKDKIFCENCNAIRYADYTFGDGVSILEWFDSIERCCDNPGYLWVTDIFKPKQEKVS